MFGKTASRLNPLGISEHAYSVPRATTLHKIKIAVDKPPKIIF